MSAVAWFGLGFLLGSLLMALVLLRIVFLKEERFDDQS